MQWLAHGEITQAAIDALVRHGHAAHRLAELDLAQPASAHDIFAAMRLRQWDLITTDAAMTRNSLAGGKPFTRSIVYLQVSGGEVEQDDAIDRLFARYKRLAPGRLYTVTENRVKVRQLPTQARQTMPTADRDASFEESRHDE